MVKARQYQVLKCFKVGESVRIIQGSKAGEQGIITKILQNSEGNDSHAVISMVFGNIRHDHTVMINNLRLKQEVDPNTSMQISTHYFQKNANIEQLNAGDLVMYQNHSKVGLVIQTSPEYLSVLNELNKFDHVSLNEVSRKIIYNSRLMLTVDYSNNVITRGTLVKIREKQHPFYGSLGEIRAIHRDTLFVFIKNQSLFRSNGYICIQARHVVNAGANHMKEINE